ncbi:HvfC/BufC N-terminal domain-containing protein [Pelagibius marinus]|uniref:HvfC/BufC N-terminal domain-containing protein n=1 Tax=Pelagibius marinus TaxID=2762760 RepID=UPI00187235F4|nr:putative DNA-binding domain-containing protein [Pelagibius marinus]
MQQLSALQSDLRRAILSGDSRASHTAIRPLGLPPAQRLRIHANHYRITLSEALAATYPVVARLLGEPCFAGLAREFIQLSPPTSPCLFEYGGGFAHYLDAVPLLMELPYLPDVARLEWALNEARHAADAAALPPAALALLQDCCFAEVVLTLHPSSRLVTSSYPIDRIWRTNQPGADPETTIGLDEGGTRLLIHRDGDDDVVWCPLSPCEFDFLQALRAGVPLGCAWGAASRADASFDGGRTLSGLLAAGVLADFRFPTTQA